MDASSATPAPPRIAIVGAGRVGTALGVAIARAGWPVVAVASRDPGRRARFCDLVPTALPVASPVAVLDRVDLVFLTVPDDTIAVVAADLRLRAGQCLVHTSGALPASVLAPAQVDGSWIASFHPLMPFVDTPRAVDTSDGREAAEAFVGFAGATIAIEGDEHLVAVLSGLAGDLGARPLRVPAGGKAAYHAAAVLAAGGFVALLSAITELGRASGLDEATALDAFGPLVRAGLNNARSLGVPAALTGPYVRGDRATVRLHLDAVEHLTTATRDLYVVAGRSQIDLAVSRGDLEPDRADELRHLLDG